MITDAEEVIKISTPSFLRPNKVVFLFFERKWKKITPQQDPRQDEKVHRECKEKWLLHSFAVYGDD